MKTLITIPVHSFVDLITNSSSELFVCNGAKTIETVKEVLTKLAQHYNELAEYKISAKTELFTEIFKEPTLSEYTFQYWDFPSRLREEYEKYNNMHHRTEGVYWGGDERNYENSDRYIVLQEKQDEMQKKFPVPAYIEKPTKAQKKKYDSAWKKQRDEEYKIWKDCGDSAQATINLFKWFLTNNGVSSKEVEKIKFTINPGRYAYIDVEEGKVREMYDTFKLYLDYNISCNKGDVIIKSASDNSIPYELMSSIETYLNAQRWHI
jgi:hypothetical protein